MDSRSRYGICGFVISIAGFGWLVFMFWDLHAYGIFGPDVLGNLHRFALWVISSWHASWWACVLCGVWEVHLGTFLCVKAVCNPPRYWQHTGRHLAITSSIAWVVATVCFVAISLMPR